MVVKRWAWLMLCVMVGLAGCEDDATTASGDTLAGDGTSGDTTGVDAEPGDATTEDSSEDTGGGDTSEGDSTPGDTSAGDASDTTSGDTGCAVDRQCGGACCSSSEFCIFNSCTETCVSGVTCGPTGGLCCPTGQSCLEDGTCGIDCEDGRDACGTTDFNKVCCDAGQVCLDGSCQADCGENVLCDGVCCDAGLVCQEGACVADCPDALRLCGEQSEICCDEGDVCLGGSSCVTTGDACALTEECDVDEYCEPTLGFCVPRDQVQVCEFRPTPGTLVPQIGCRWTPPAGAWASHDDVVATPAVANLTDDNGDGVTDAGDIPDIVFISFDKQGDGCCSEKSTVRVVSGDCNADGTMRTIATLGGRDSSGSIDDFWIHNSGGVALGNLHPASETAERAPEIVAPMGPDGVVAWRRTSDDGSTWEVMWRNNDYPTANVHERNGSQISLADLNADGAPEVIIGAVVLNGQTGELFWDGLALHGSGDGVGSGIIGPSSVVADIDLDLKPEVLAGNRAYNGEDGSLQWEYEYVGENSRFCSRCDGLTAVGNFDADPEGEVVIVRLGEIFVLEHNGNEKYRFPIPWDNCRDRNNNIRNEAGPPTVADFDGDGKAEVGAAGADFYVVFDFDECLEEPLPSQCEREAVLWTVSNFDCSSRTTGSSVFDFDGDGKAEVVYADERNFRVFDGTTGAIILDDDTHSSNTRMEMPIVVDVDNDGKAEIIVPEPNNSTSLGGIEVWESANNDWVRTRRIWNQHSYSVTNVTEDGQIPAVADINWVNGRLNNFRQNVQPGGLFDAPDLIVEDITLEACGEGGQAIFAVTIANDGALGVAPGVPVVGVITVTDTGDTHTVVGATTERVLPGGSTVVTLTWEIPSELSDGTAFTITVTADSDGEGGQTYNECLEDNNEATGEGYSVCRSN